MADAGAAIVWFRGDLRLADNPALFAAARHERLLPVYIWAPEEEGEWAPGAASRWWLHDSLRSLADSLDHLGCRLTLKVGPSCATLLNLAHGSRASAVYWNELTEPDARSRDAVVRMALERAGLKVRTFKSHLLHDPSTLLSQAGRPYLVYGAFWRAACDREVDDPLPSPRSLPPPPKIDSLTLESLGLKPKIPWGLGLRTEWRAGEAAGKAALAAFCKLGLADYQVQRDLPAERGTSRLSPHLHFGELSPRQAWHAASTAWHAERRLEISQYLKEIVWREFSHHLLYHYPALANAPLRPEFEAFPWAVDAEGLKAWQRGETGFPIVDAGMRELWRTGWMHNRVRMIAASFLVKDLRTHWLHGAKWFWDTLVDADLANNTQGWQWTAGCGADAAPYFRIFNPTLQGKRFDPEGTYIRRWLPELRNVPTRHIHAPWDAGMFLSYPTPIVSHAAARALALDSFQKLRGARFPSPPRQRARVRASR